MQITVNIPDDLAIQAQARGLSLERYLAALLAADLALGVATSPVKSEAIQVGTTLTDLENLLDQITRYSDKIRPLPEHAFTRESMYQDHD